MFVETILNFLEKMIEAEEKIVISINDSIENLENYAVKTALKGISLDSQKHAEMYRSALIIMNEKSQPLDEKQFDEQRDLVSRHIKMEEDVMGKLEKMMPKIENERISFLLETILSDERRHHKVLRKLHETLVRGETILEQDWWDAIWKDVPGLWI
jgi:rubrerythrin